MARRCAGALGCEATKKGRSCMTLYLRTHQQRKDGKVHGYWSLIENRRYTDGWEAALLMQVKDAGSL